MLHGESLLFGSGLLGLLLLHGEGFGFLAGLLFDARQYDQALQQLDGSAVPGIAPLAADRRGDVLAAQGKTDEAKAAWQQAWEGLPESLEYRRLVEAKLTAVGAAPAASGAAQ